MPLQLSLPEQQEEESSSTPAQTEPLTVVFVSLCRKGRTELVMVTPHLHMHTPMPTHTLTYRSMHKCSDLMNYFQEYKWKFLVDFEGSPLAASCVKVSV